MFSAQIILLIFQYSVASHVCCNRDELHFLAIWINEFCFDKGPDRVV